MLPTRRAWYAGFVDVSTKREKFNSLICACSKATLEARHLKFFFRFANAFGQGICSSTISTKVATELSVPSCSVLLPLCSKMSCRQPSPVWSIILFV